MSLINAKRLRDYPRLMFITTWTILAFNLIFRQGWLGALKQIIGSDFVTLYGAGLAFRTDLAHLYDFASQGAIQQGLIHPTPLPGVNPFISPPYVAAAYSLFTYLPLPLAFILWTMLSMLFTMGAVRLLMPILPESIKSKLSYWQLIIIVLSFFPFIEGLQVGQNHALTLLLVTCVLIFTLSERWYLAGSMAGLMIYKPQLVLGFLLIWIVWRKYKALAAFATVTLLWAGAFYIIGGMAPYMAYISMSRDLVLLPYIPGFPGYLLLTFYGLLTTLFPIEALPIIRPVTTVLSGIFAIGLVWIAFRLRNKPILDRTPVLVLAILFPLGATPYALLHDMVILIPGFVLWARYASSRCLLYTVIAIYLGGFFLPLFAALTKVALMSILLIGLVALIFLWFYKQRNDAVGRNEQ
jgi:hypothetical protein